MRCCVILVYKRLTQKAGKFKSQTKLCSEISSQKKKKSEGRKKYRTSPSPEMCSTKQFFFLSKTDCLKYCKVQVSKQERTSLLACCASLQADVVILAITVETLTCSTQPSRLRELETRSITASLSPSAPLHASCPPS